MFVAAPRCGLMKQHDSHWDNLYDRQCAGWTDVQEAVEKLCEMLVRWSRLAQLDTVAMNAENRLKLYVHPQVRTYLVAHIEPDFRSFTMGGMLPSFPPEIDVVIDPELPTGSWRFEIARGAM